jgi:hypothetical protein
MQNPSWGRGVVHEMWKQIVASVKNCIGVHGKSLFSDKANWNEAIK